MSRQLSTQQKSESIRTLVLGAISELVVFQDLEQKIIWANQAATESLGISLSDLVGRKCYEVWHQRSLPCEACPIVKSLKTGAPQKDEIKSPDGRTWLVRAYPVRGADQEIMGMVEVTLEITQRKHMQDQLEASIREKEFLLQEIHHRVKNNLQVISSILDLSSLRTEDPCALDLIENARSKIQTMAFIHSQLYRSEHFDQIEMGEHIGELVRYLKAVYAAGKDIRFHIDISEVYLSLTQAIPCALVLNELVSNAFKHAFKRKRSGNIVIAMEISAGNTAVVNVKDDGAGVPKDFKLNSTETLGLKLVRNLVERQLKGKIRLTRKKYTEFHITFPLQSEEGEDG